MGTEILNLQNELEQAKSSLKNVDEHLKKLIGRDPSEFPPRITKRTIQDDKGRLTTKNFGHGRGYTFENEEPPSKRRTTSVFSRLSDKIPDIPQKGLISKVIVTPKEIPSREQALQAQNRDEKFRARNKRMFGALLGTLQKFQQEETKLKSREDKRAQLEKKIEEHEIKEKEEVRRERQELFLNRKKKQAYIKILELKMLRMKEYNAWEETQKPRKNYILTKSKPHIHYLPRKLNDKTKVLLTSSKNEIERVIEIKKQQVTEELQHIEDRIKRNFDNRIIKSDNINNGEPEVQDSEEHFDDVLTESQMAIANVNKQPKDLEEEEVQSQEKSVIDEPSESNGFEKNMESNNSGIIDSNITEKHYECQADKTSSEIEDKTVENCENINEKNELVEEKTNEETTNFTWSY